MVETPSILKNVTRKDYTVRAVRIDSQFTSVCYGADPTFTTFDEAVACAEAKAAAFVPTSSSMDTTHYRVVRREHGVKPRCRKAEWVSTDLLDVPVAGPMTDHCYVCGVTTTWTEDEICTGCGRQWGHDVPVASLEVAVNG